MSTASKTPNLGLMSPVASDPFDPADFDATFAILDANPGTLTVPNQASRPTGWSSNQHGRMVWQADLNVMWVWNQPSSSVAGSWTRIGGYGLLGSALNPTQINATQVNWTTAPVAVQTTVMVPGGRPCLIMVSWLYITNDKTRQATLNFIENSSSVLERRFDGASFGVLPDAPPQAGSYFYTRGAQPTQQQVNFQLRIRAQDPAVVDPGQAGGTSSIWNPTITVFEM